MLAIVVRSPARRNVRTNSSAGNETLKMRWILIFCGMSLVIGVGIVIARPFMPFEGMIFIAVGLVLPVQVVLLRRLI